MENGVGVELYGGLPAEGHVGYGHFKKSDGQHADIEADGKELDRKKNRPEKKRGICPLCLEDAQYCQKPFPFFRTHAREEPFAGTPEQPDYQISHQSREKGRGRQAFPAPDSQGAKQKQEDEGLKKDKDCQVVKDIQGI
jgi:hypothetical protein